jgi:hypothetical protein
MAILCKNSTAILQLGGGSNYTVLGFDHGNYTITLVSADALAGGGHGYPRVQENAIILPEVWHNFSTTGKTAASPSLNATSRPLHIRSRTSARSTVEALNKVTFHRSLLSSLACCKRTGFGFARCMGYLCRRAG